ncbi:phosphoribosylglycinamide formyltransferase [Corynebacterium mendelii]|uniref:phosphoribosylglycinamide formyltransferase n=1 Tax=Corynebacterium mendelii TaxID=2765362 RepID=UPI002ECFF818
MNTTELATTPDTRARTIVVLASGQGSLLKAIAAGAGDSYTVGAVVCDRHCPAADWAAGQGLPCFVVGLAPGADRAEWNRRLAETVAAVEPDLVVSAGFMKILGPEFIDRFHGSILNTHPALLPSFPGAHAVADALAYGVTVTGCTVHEIDEGVDTGRIVAQVAVPVLPGDSQEVLHERIKVEERALIVTVLQAADPMHPTITG